MGGFGACYARFVVTLGVGLVLGRLGPVKAPYEGDVPPGTVPLPMLDPEPSAAPEAEASEGTKAMA